MQPLANIQSGVRDAIVRGDFASLTPFLAGGRAPEHRLGIHRRHYEQSLIRALLEKFPATIWLVGSQFITEAARIFVGKYPPCTPCIAEYGKDFPEFLTTCQGADQVPYLRGLANLEWHISHAAIAVDEPPMPIQELSAIPAEVLPDTVLTLQTGVRYLQTSWPVDELMKVYLAEMRPARLEFVPEEVWLQIAGARGEFRLARLGKSEFSFRKCILEGRTIGDAAEEALAEDAAFDPGTAFTALFSSGLVTAIAQGEP